MRSLLTALLAALTLLIAPATPSMAKEPVYQSFLGGTAINGYDPVAYFDEGRPVEGSADFTHRFICGNCPDPASLNLAEAVLCFFCPGLFYFMRVDTQATFQPVD